jgi:signal transduction histidine kinase
LLGNALKFTPTGGEIAISLSATGETAAMTVRDNGPGIRDEECDKVFDKFAQSDARTGAGGTGLGLTICREIIERHQGRIRAVPTHGCGAHLEVVLPTWKPEGGVQPANSADLVSATR